MIEKADKFAIFESVRMHLSEFKTDSVEVNKLHYFLEQNFINTFVPALVFVIFDTTLLVEHLQFKLVSSEIHLYLSIIS